MLILVDMDGKAKTFKYVPNTASYDLYYRKSKGLQPPLRNVTKNSLVREGLHQLLSISMSNVLTDVINSFENLMLNINWYQVYRNSQRPLSKTYCLYSSVLKVSPFRQIVFYNFGQK